MKILAVILCSMVGVSFASRCDYSKCEDLSPLNELEEIQFLPNEQQLLEYCPKLLKFLDCSMRAFESCHGQPIIELMRSNDESVKEETAMHTQIGLLVSEICNPAFRLHKDYIANVDCFRGFSTVGPRMCDVEAKNDLEDFLTKARIERDGSDAVLNDEIECLEEAITAACVSVRLGKTCGEPARKTLVKVLQRLQPVMGSRCNGGPNNLKVRFMLNLEVSDEELIPKINEIFNMYRRRR